MSHLSQLRVEEVEIEDDAVLVRVVPRVVWERVIDHLHAVHLPLEPFTAHLSGLRLG